MPASAKVGSRLSKRRTMVDPALMDGPEAEALKERERFAQILVLFGRHGLKGLAARLGLRRGGYEPFESARPDSVVALLRDIGPLRGPVRADPRDAQ